MTNLTVSFRKWLPWTVALVPAVFAIMVLDEDFRSSGMLNVFALTPAAFFVMLLMKRPWRTKTLIRRIIGSLGLFVFGVIALGATALGAPDYLKAQFGLFIGIDEFGPRAIVSTPGGYVVVGDDADSNAVVWLSSNGENWNRVNHNSVFERLDLADVIAGGPGLIMVAHDDKRGSVIVLTSSDGNEWVRARSPVEDGKPNPIAVNNGKLGPVGSTGS